jgi:hypothetical protein
MSFNRSKRTGFQWRPVLLYFIYLILVAGDVLTTFLASPNLKFENNFIITKFNLSWSQIIAGAYIGSNILFFLFLYFSHRLKYARSLFEKRILQIMISIFVYHFCFSFFITINNLLSLIYLQQRAHGFILSVVKCYIGLIYQYNNFYFLFSLAIYILSLYLVLYFTQQKRISHNWR